MRTWEQLRKEVLRDEATAAAYIRLALEENDLPALVRALRNVHAVRGTLKGLGLRAAELQRVLDLLIAGHLAWRLCAGQVKPQRRGH